MAGVYMSSILRSQHPDLVDNLRRTNRRDLFRGVALREKEEQGAGGSAEKERGEGLPVSERTPAVL